MDTYRLFVIAHVVSGTIALICFWLAGSARKGGPLHVRAGRVYLLAMLAVILTGAPLAQALAARGQQITALFLTYLLLLTASASWQAWRAVRRRRDRAGYYDGLYWTLNISVGLGGVAMIALGLQTQAVLLQIFGGVGVFGLVGALRGARRAPDDARWWLKEHYGNLIGCGVATHIAFLGIGLRRLLPMIDGSVLTLVSWCAPLVGAVIAAIYLDRRYGRAPAHRAPAPAVPLSTAQRA